MLLAWLFGMTFALAFAPFHYPPCLFLGLFGFFYLLKTYPNSGRMGFSFGFGAGLIGVSWVYNSIYEYGHLSKPLSVFFTLIFLAYIGVFYCGFAYSSRRLANHLPKALWPLILAANWCVFEWIRAHLFGGFPWLLVGFSALNTPLENILPILGIYGPSFIACFSLGFLILAIEKHNRSPLFAIIGVMGLVMPKLMPTQIDNANPLPKVHAAVVQANVNMQEKWNEDLFWRQYGYYFSEIQQLLKKHRVVILPEAAISVPSAYIPREIKQLNRLANFKESALLIGIPESTKTDPNQYFNAIVALGQAQGQYHKQQLVMFGETIPKFWHPLFNFLGIPVISTVPGTHHQPPVTVFGQPIASLICYELAYPEILRRQLPQGQWIVSLSDDGWFGHSSALYQHQEMAQVLSFMAHRWQVFVNNNGLSSIIDAKGQIVKQIPAWQAGHLTSAIEAYSTSLPWMLWGDKPILGLCCLIILMSASWQLMRKLSWPRLAKHGLE